MAGKDKEGGRLKVRVAGMLANESGGGGGG